MGNTTGNAQQLRDLIDRIATKAIKRINPPARIGQVKSIDRLNNRCEVQFAGESSSITVNMTPGIQPRFALDDGQATTEDGSPFGDIVRVAGKTGAYYILQVISSSSVNLQVDEDIKAIDDAVSEQAGTISEIQTAIASDGLAPVVSPTPVVYGATGAAVVLFAPLLVGPRSSSANPDAVTYELHVSAVDTAAPSASTLVSAEATSPVWVRVMPTTSLPLPYDADTYFAIVARDEDGAASPSPWVAGRPVKSGDNDLAMTVDTLLANNLIVEVLKLVDLVVSGEFTANSQTVLGDAAFRNLVELGQGSQMRMRGQTTAPVTPPTPADVLLSVPCPGGSSGLFNQGDIMGTQWYQLEGDRFAPTVARYDTGTGVRTQVAASVALPANTSQCTYQARSLVVVGTSFYLWYERTENAANTTPAQFYQIYDSSFVRTSTINGIQYNPGTGVTNLVYGKGQNGRLIVAGHQTDSKYGYVHELTPSTGAIAQTVRMANNVSWSDLSFSDRASILAGTFDLDTSEASGGTRRYIMVSRNSCTVYSATLARKPEEDWVLADSGTSGVGCMAWGEYVGSNGFSAFQHMVGPPASRTLYRYGDTWSDAQRNTIWIGYTWYNDTGTPMETFLGGVAKFFPRKRWATRVTLPTFPSTANKARIYVAQGSVQPDPTLFFRKGETTTKVAVLALDFFITGVGGVVSPGTNPPNSTSNPRPFTGGASAAIYDSSTGYWKADGEYLLDLSKNKANHRAGYEKRTAQTIVSAIDTRLDNTGVTSTGQLGTGVVLSTRNMTTPTQTVPVLEFVEPGRYEGDYKVTWGVNGNARRACTLKWFRAADSSTVDLDIQHDSPTGFQTTQTGKFDEIFATGDYLYLVVFQNTNNNLDIVAPSSSQKNFVFLRAKRVA